MSNLIIVESENDQYFIEALIDNLNLPNIKVGIPICKIDDFDCLGGYTKLTANLQSLKLDKYSKIGIILDADEVGIIKRVSFINETLKSICTDVTLDKINQLKKSNILDLSIACYITNVDGQGELETVMRKIKSQNSIYADCLTEWKKCLTEQGKIIKDKEFDKVWVSNYLKYDTCIGKDRHQKSKKCANELINNTANINEVENNLMSNTKTIKKNIWNFDDPILKELKIFLKLFN
ncbi:MAG: hypothetical protein GQ570_15430 [Helicobacteraceae bacterium]|nr:hypothetical protein [Helicobacteraceae bacterium]